MLGLLIATLYWVLDAFVNVSFFGVHNTFSGALLNPTPVEFWMRVIVIGLLPAFSWHARRLGIRLADSMNHLKLREQELDSHRDMQHVLRRQADELNRQMVRQANEQEMLRKLAYQDPLTGLYNRRRIEEILNAASLTEQLSGTGLGVLFCDIDQISER